MSNTIKKVCHFILPILELKEAESRINKRVKETLNTEKLLLTSDEMKKVELEELEKLYDDTFSVKKTLEDKAKSGIVGVTITIGLVYSITLNYEKLSLFTLILAIIALLYSLIAGYLALNVISDKNQVYKLTVKDLLLKIKPKKDILLLSYTLNVDKNIIRNNYVFSSYKHLVYSVVILIVAFLSNPFFYKKSSSSIKSEIICTDLNQTIKELNNKLDIHQRQIEFLLNEDSYDKSSSINQYKVKINNFSDRNETNLTLMIKKYPQTHE